MKHPPPVSRYTLEERIAALEAKVASYQRLEKSDQAAMTRHVAQKDEFQRWVVERDRRIADLLAALENIALLRTVPPRSATADQRLTAAVNLANHAIAAAHQGEGTP